MNIDNTYDNDIVIKKAGIVKKVSTVKNKKAFYNKQQFYIFILAVPGLLWYFVFKYLPLLGIGYAFTDKGFKQAVSFVGVENFVRLFSSPDFKTAFSNTLIISVITLAFYFPVPIILALLMNEIFNKQLKRFVQFVVYIPYFFSWAVVGGLFVIILSPSTGIINQLIGLFGVKPIYFMASESWFRVVLVASNIWKSAGFGTVIYIAAISAIDMQLYEAAIVDGAGRWRRLWHITLPSISSTIATVLLLSISTIMLMFEQIFVMYTPVVYNVADVLQTLSYREGLLNQNIGFATAVSLFTAIISTVLVFGTNMISKKVIKESII